MSPVELVFGAFAFADPTSFEGFEKQKEALDVLAAEGVTLIDTATVYGESESVLGSLDAAKTHAIDSKFPGAFGPAPATKENIIKTAEDGLAKLKADHVLAPLKKLRSSRYEVYYLHAPDRNVPLETQLEAINTLYESGKFKRFGLSNYLASEVEDVVRIAKENNWILPTVYQGNYSAIARRAENELLPTLRKHGIQFYAYSPGAGGFLAKSVESLVQSDGGRWDPTTFVGGLYHKLYNRPALVEGLRLWETIAREAGVSGIELAYRWVIHNSGLRGEYGDKVVIGGRNLAQVKSTLALAKKGPLDGGVARRIDEVWKIVEGESPLDNFNA
ncbi:aldo/keto reductase family protein [Aspergillus lucknowensis]|uniref:NADP-dependent oxidoreductase domain-containing protein n=1 Tax=Aspergillus lucknowensis TaxID=176173 RepID=A0ABR4LFF7_9EURO